jgi:Zn-dependent protease
MMRGTVRIFSIRGIPILVHASWLFIYGLIAWTLAVGYFPQTLPDLPDSRHWIDGFIAAGLLFVSVLLHELAHAFVAQRHGLRVNGISLHILGGMSELDDEPPSPRAELLMAAAGPLTSLAIAGALWVIGGTGYVRGGSLGAILAYLLLVNVAVGVFNMLPGFPLDGGRVLRALVWKWTGDLVQATHVASRAGTLVAAALIGFGILRGLDGSLVGGLWLTVIGVFVHHAARASAQRTALREALRDLRVDDVMRADVVTVPTYATAASLADAFWQHHVTSVAVVDATGAARGLITVDGLRAVPRDRWPLTRVSEIMRPLDANLTVRSGDSAVQAFDRATRNGLGHLVVTDDAGRLVGWLGIDDLSRALMLRGPERGAAAKQVRRLHDAA